MEDRVEEEQDVGYREVHRTVLTYLRAHKSVEHGQLVEDFKIMFDATEGTSTHTDEEMGEKLAQIIAEVNSRISRHGFKIDKKNDEVSGQLMYIFVNTNAEGMSEMNSNYGTNELVAVKEVIEYIIDRGGFGFSIGRVNAQQIIASSLKRTIRESAYLLERLVDDGWFRMTREEKIVLSVKSLSELNAYLIDRYGIRDKTNDGKLLVCQRCNDLVTIGMVCSNNQCPVAFHQRCLDIHRRTSSSPSSCVNSDCGYDWEKKAPRQVGVSPASFGPE